MVPPRGKPAQGLVEFALVLPILLIVAIGLFDIGRAFYALVVITNASREGARYLTLHGDDNLNSPPFADTKAAAVREALNSGITLNTTNISVVGGCTDADPIPGCDSGTKIRVEASITFQPIFAGIFPVTLPMTRATEMMIP